MERVSPGEQESTGLHRGTLAAIALASTMNSGGGYEVASRNEAQMKPGFILHSFVLSSFISWFIALH